MVLLYAKIRPHDNVIYYQKDRIAVTAPERTHASSRCARAPFCRTSATRLMFRWNAIRQAKAGVMQPAETHGRIPSAAPAGDWAVSRGFAV
jgi:hypothetical protein